MVILFCLLTRDLWPTGKLLTLRVIAKIQVLLQGALGSWLECLPRAFSCRAQKTPTTKPSDMRQRARWRGNGPINKSPDSDRRIFANVRWGALFRDQHQAGLLCQTHTASRLQKLKHKTARRRSNVPVKLPHLISMTGEPLYPRLPGMILLPPNPVQYEVPLPQLMGR